MENEYSDMKTTHPYRVNSKQHSAYMTTNKRYRHSVIWYSKQNNHKQGDKTIKERKTN